MAVGFNTWNAFGCAGISAQVMMDTADAIVSSGLAAAGYRFVNMDDCWMEAQRAGAGAGAGGAGPQVPNPSKFPHGLEPVTDATRLCRER